MNAKVTVLLSTYNGEKYVVEQIESILRQKNVDISILVRDDDSKDNTINILEQYEKQNKLHYYKGNNIKPAKSFMDLIKHASESEYYALCDQDDVWLEDKLQIAIKELEKFPKDLPALYYGRPRLVDEKLNILPNPEFSKHKMLSYGSSIINSNATGCTMVFNKKLLEKLRISDEPEYIQMHDAWIHKVCLICNGHIFFDDDVHILYRQHGNNAIGISNSKIKKIKRHLLSLKNGECSRSRTIKSLYACYGNEMSRDDKEMSEIVVNYQKNIRAKIKLLFNKKIKTGYKDRDRMFRISVLFNAF